VFRFTFGSRFFAVFVVLSSAFVSFVVSSTATAQGADADLLARVGDSVERYYARAQTIVATETVTVEPVSRRLKPAGPARKVVNEMRIEWDAQVGSEPRAVRELVSAAGPRRGPPGQPDCLDPRSFTIEPLGFLLAANRDKFRFSIGRLETLSGVRARRIDYVPRTPGPPRTRWDGKCGWVDTFGRTRGSVWVDPATGEVLRFSERLSGNVDLPGPAGDPNAPRFVAERADTAIEYKKVAFVNPDETLLLPSRVESITFIRNSGVPRARVIRTFTDYRRFVTTGRIRP
jgi:hypothetical protein